MNASLWIELAPIDRLDGELIVAEVLGKDRAFLHAHPEYNIKKKELEKIHDLVNRRKLGEPLAYILGHKEFYGRDFKVTSSTLIPRPETEALITEIINLRPQTILDVGTGSGCIAITLAKELPEAEITAVDISEDALGVAQENAKTYQADIDFRQSDLLKGLAKTEKYDLIVANLPYVDANWDWLGTEINFEPKNALYAKDGGLEFIKKLIDQAPDHLNPDACLVLEADITQHQEIIKYAQRTGSFSCAKKADENSALALVLQLR